MQHPLYWKELKIVKGKSRVEIRNKNNKREGNRYLKSREVEEKKKVEK
jgi:hypothetical protein